jgi:hypothetical protein
MIIPVQSEGVRRYVGANGSASPVDGGIAAARAGCSDCMLYSEGGPGGRTAGVRICCTRICKYGFGCVDVCTSEVCWTPPAGEIYV